MRLGGGYWWWGFVVARLREGGRGGHDGGVRGDLGSRFLSKPRLQKKDK